MTPRARKLILRAAFAVVAIGLLACYAIAGYIIYKASTWPDECLHTVIRKENCTR